jgi:hypothetical protein
MNSCHDVSSRRRVRQAVSAVLPASSMALPYAARLVAAAQPAQQAGAGGW